jgi:hypothetical protein
MKLTLDTENDIVQYLNYLHQRSSLTTKFPTITLDGKECHSYLEWLYNQDPEEEFDVEPEEVVIETRNVNKRWSPEEDNALSSLILENLHPSDIGKALKRTEDGVRHRARSNLSMAYQNGKWRDYHYTN